MAFITIKEQEAIKYAISVLNGLTNEDSIVNKKVLENIMAKSDKANEIARERTRIWNKSHPDEHRKHCRDYARRHPDRVRERIKKCNDKKRKVLKEQKLIEKTFN